MCPIYKISFYKSSLFEKEISAEIEEYQENNEPWIGYR